LADDWSSTRLSKDLFGPGLDKKHFLIFDFCENLEFFGKKPEGAKDTTNKSLSQRLFEQRLKLVHLLQKKDETELLQYPDELQTLLVCQEKSRLTRY
jgi:type I restriction enzyme, R subunit